MSRNWTKKAVQKYGWTYSGLEYYMTDVWRYLCKRQGVDAADRIIAPLTWWIKTGRANLAECKALIEKKPYIIGRILTEKDGHDYNEILTAIRQKIGMLPPQENECGRKVFETGKTYSINGGGSLTVTGRSKQFIVFRTESSTETRKKIEPELLGSEAVWIKRHDGLTVVCLASRQMQ